MTEQRVTRLSNYLALDDEDMPVEALPPDLGDQRLNLLVSFLNYNFQVMKEDSDSKFDAVNSRFDNLDRRVNSLTARFENRFKERGGDNNSPQAYEPIVNRLNQYPQERELNRITSLNQINRFTDHQTTGYLHFYDLNEDGTLQEKKLRLIEFLGINVETRVITIKVPGAKV